MTLLHRIWNDIRQGENIDLYLTILAAFGLGILNIVGSVPSSWVSSIILAALGVLAISSLKNEYRTGEMLSRLSSSSTERLRSRSELMPGIEMARSATEISILGVSGISIFINELHFFEQKLKEGCKLRVVLLNPVSPALQTWNSLNKITTTEGDIKSALELLKGLTQTEKAKGKCEVRLINVYPPYGLFISSNKNKGLMNVEFYTYKTTFHERPHVLLSQEQNQNWYNFYKEQFEHFWSDSEKWNPS